eukprot:8900226-Alexandrium_andersonii.AAC.1
MGRCPSRGCLVSFKKRPPQRLFGAHERRARLCRTIRAVPSTGFVRGLQRRGLISEAAAHVPAQARKQARTRTHAHANMHGDRPHARQRARAGAHARKHATPHGRVDARMLARA